MSDERWTKVTHKDAEESPDRRYFVASRYDNARGQRVESIRWCDAHDDKMSGDTCTTHDQAMAYSCDPDPCNVVEATLILPPRAEP